MKDIITVAKFTMKDMLSRKSFRISTIIILVLIVLGFNIPNIINSLSDGKGFSDTILIVDRDNLFQGKLDQLNEADGDGFSVKVSQDNDDSIKEQINNGDISSALVINKTSKPSIISVNYVVKNSATAGALPKEILFTIQDIYSNLKLTEKGFSEQDIASIMPPLQVAVQQVEEQEVGGDIFVMMIMSIVLFYAIYFCAYQVSSSITVEKTSKIIETLVTSTSPHNIVLGKTIGIGLVGLLQMVLIVGTALISAFLFLDRDMLAAVLNLSNLTPLLGIVTLVYFVLGYFMYAFAYALTGSTVSKPEDIQAANTPVAILCMIGFYLAYFTLTDPTSSLNLFAAIFPISSPFCMPIRMMMGLAAPWEVIVSILVLLATIFVVSRITIKIYSDAILNYGTRLSLSELLKMYKQK